MSPNPTYDPRAAPHLETELFWNETDYFKRLGVIGRFEL
jgi:hypothetical protein